ncbi:uncharacterized protein ACHE_10973S [Aspergillus chevalieri]|uniref:Uncharacterized protein n=1 Tax=Aspergillus chevalieri TaxID=182096 RepID=A0A7R7ZJS4_ASPCH|nr:uncharacterized protein ACHE_10973S [Aspergillus chevalieri]BCR83571.1 hypothetical protein ACHE_10973S [Aspergillus chevalieri]
MSTPTNFETWRQTNALHIVPMGGLYFHDFAEKAAIGTEHLGSCSVVVIASKLGAILAHIAPQPAATNDPFAGDANVRTTMGDVAALYQNKREYFPSAATIVVCALFRGEVALPDQLNIMTASLRALSLDPRAISYDVPGDPTIRGKGTVMVMNKREWDRPKIIVEERTVFG